MSEISCATDSSYLACALLVSVMVATPTSKLRFACASCSETRSSGFRQVDVVLREQHVEIRPRHAQHQVLLRGGERVVGLQHLLVRLADGDPVRARYSGWESVIEIDLVLKSASGMPSRVAWVRKIEPFADTCGR